MPINLLTSFPSAAMSLRAACFETHFRGSKGLFYRPVIRVKALPESNGGKSNILSPIRKYFGSSIERYDNIVRAIAHLGMLCSPSYVARGVVAIIIDTIKRGAFWALSEVGKKTFKLQKFWSYFDSPAAIMFPSCIVRVITSSPYVAPDGILSGVPHAVSFMHSDYYNICHGKVKIA